MKIRRKIKRSTKQYIIVAVICIVVIGGAAALTTLMISGQVKDKYVTLLADAHREMEDNKKTVYVAMADIMTGESITKKNVKMQKIYATQPEKTYISSEDIGKVAIVDITEGTQVLKGMLSGNAISSELRELEYSVINISTNITNNNTVDVRISYPNGESYVVLSKKLVKGYTPGTSTCFFWMDEEEILRMSAAIVDAGLYTGSSLFITKYIEPNIQEASVVNYTPSLSILTLLENDPNILDRSTQKLSRQVRKALENRLADSLVTDVSSINWDVDPNKQIVTPTPTPIPLEENIPGSKPITQKSDTHDIPDVDNELGSLDTSDGNFYFAEEDIVKVGDIEYGD